MSKRNDLSIQEVQQVVGILSKLPKKWLLTLAVVALLIGAVYFISQRASPAKQLPPGTYFFCSWNVQDFFDDEIDPKNNDATENWFAHNPDAFHLKVDHLADALLLMNNGNGPDILAMHEVESAKCISALKDTLNDRLTKAGRDVPKYEHVLFLGDKLGRRFAPGILTKLPVEADRTRKITNYAGNGRTLEGHITVNGHDLAILAAHWTSRLDHGGKGGNNAERRMSYAKDCYGRFKAIVKANPDADVILCGDFNDESTDPSIRDGLHVSGDIDEVRNAIDEPRPFNLFANWPANADPHGSIVYGSHWSIFDHICVSRGMLDDKGWSYEPESRSIFAPGQLRRPGKNGKEEPFRFGNANATEHGYSDHFPVTALLKVN